MKIPPSVADAFALAFAAKPNLVVTSPPPTPARPIPGEVVRMRYENWRGEVSVRTVLVETVWFGSTEWHPQKQWMFTAHEPKTRKERDFAIAGVLEWDLPEKPAKEPRFWIVWNPAHPTTPTLKHKKKVSAEIAAKKLCRKHPDQAESIFVMQATSAWTMGEERPKGRHF